MPLDFPSSPVVGQYYNGYIWDGTVWDSALQPSVPALLTTAPVYADAAARTTAVPSPAEGQLSYLNDINQFQGYAGTSWRPLGGLAPIVPPTVNFSGGSASSNSSGVISFSSVTSISLNNCFTSSYTNYLLMWDFLCSADNAPNLKLRAGGVDTTNDYWAGRSYQIDGSVGGQNNSTNAAWGITANAVKKYQGSMNLWSPKVAAATYMNHISYFLSSNVSAGSMGQQSGIGAYFLATSFDGFTLFPSSGTFSGTIQVLGYNS